MAESQSSLSSVMRWRHSAVMQLLGVVNACIGEKKATTCNCQFLIPESSSANQ